MIFRLKTNINIEGGQDLGLSRFVLKLEGHSCQVSRKQNRIHAFIPGLDFLLLDAFGNSPLQGTIWAFISRVFWDEAVFHLEENGKIDCYLNYGSIFHFLTHLILTSLGLAYFFSTSSYLELGPSILILVSINLVPFLMSYFGLLIFVRTLLNQANPN